MKTLGYVLRSWRNHNDLTLEQAAQQTGLMLETYRRAELGKSLKGGTLAKLLRWLLTE